VVGDEAIPSPSSRTDIQEQPLVTTAIVCAGCSKTKYLRLTVPSASLVWESEAATGAAYTRSASMTEIYALQSLLGNC
jgi:hypothetical protein